MSRCIQRHRFADTSLCLHFENYSIVKCFLQSGVSHNYNTTCKMYNVEQQIEKCTYASKNKTHYLHHPNNI